MEYRSSNRPPVIVRSVQSDILTNKFELPQTDDGDRDDSWVQVRARKRTLKKWDLRELDPFLDEGILRVGSRLR